MKVRFPKNYAEQFADWGTLYSARWHVYELDYLRRMILDGIALRLPRVPDVEPDFDTREFYSPSVRQDDGPAMTLQEVGDQLGISRERVAQIERHALRKLRAFAVAQVFGFTADEWRARVQRYKRALELEAQRRHPATERRRQRSEELDRRRWSGLCAYCPNPASPPHSRCTECLLKIQSRKAVRPQRRELGRGRSRRAHRTA